MVALTAADVAVTQMDIGRKVTLSKKKYYRVKLVFGDGALTYPALGIPMPPMGKYGFVRFLDGLTDIEKASDDKFIYKYDTANNKLRIWVPDTGVELGGVAVAANRTIYAVAIGW